MVTNAELREMVCRVEAFVGITDERMDDPVLVDLLTQIINLRLDADKVQEIVVLCQAVAVLGSTRGESSKVKIPEPKAFGGARSAKELENFIWDMEQYFTAARVPDADKLNITTMYLTGDAKLWWRT
ncbi:hypothetical protein KY290_010608 [Solanum tuberosum]|uniref:Gag-pol polyprotein n=1 Tax=Solanum tuberosum TaxID=4113 RepID=A0ABQ7VY94_SOLTU|nr:hypothetical protein KY290_010608 [Solanum tuberosum]